MADTLIERPVLAAEVPLAGRQVVVEMAEPERREVARLLKLPGLARLKASLLLTRFGEDGIAVTGTIDADATQTCVVSLEPFDVHLDIPVDIRFSPDGIDPFDETLPLDDLLDLEAEDPPDLLVDGRIDLTQVIYEFFALGLDPYPRKPGVAFEPPAEGDDGGPFAALAALKPKE